MSSPRPLQELAAAEGLSTEDFAELLQRVELSQAEFGRLGGIHVSTVNRWATPGKRRDRQPPPRYAVMLAALFGMLAPRERRAVRGLLRPAPPALPAAPANDE